MSLRQAKRKRKDADPGEPPQDRLGWLSRHPNIANATRRCAYMARLLREDHEMRRNIAAAASPAATSATSAGGGGSGGGDSRRKGVAEPTRNPLDANASSVKAASLRNELELEVRLGVSGPDGRFRAGVSEPYFMELLVMMKDYDGWTEVSEWTEYDDTFYETPSVGAGTQIRTRFQPCRSTQGVPHCEHVVKTKVSSEVLRFEPNPGCEAAAGADESMADVERLLNMDPATHFTANGVFVAPDSAFEEEEAEAAAASGESGGVAKSPRPKVLKGWDVRIALSREREVVPCATREDEIVPTNFVRIKRTRHFVSGHWRFEFSKCWTGTDKAKAQLNQRANPPTCEVEIEFVDAAGFFAERADLPGEEVDAELVASLLVKVCDFFGERPRDSYQLRPTPQRRQ